MKCVLTGECIVNVMSSRKRREILTTVKDWLTTEEHEVCVDGRVFCTASEYTFPVYIVYNIVIVVGGYRWGLDWQLDLLTTYRWSLQVVTCYSKYHCNYSTHIKSSLSSLVVSR
jgi:hypothetical protein